MIMYRLMSSPYQTDIFSEGYKDRFKKNLSMDTEYWENIFWDKLMPYVSDVLDNLGIQLDYSYHSDGLYLIFFIEAKDGDHEIYSADWFQESSDIKDIWLDDSCDCESTFYKLLTKHYRYLFRNIL